MKTTPKIAQLLVNPSSGTGRVKTVVAAAQRHFLKPEWDLRVHILTGSEDAYLMAHRAVLKKYYTVIVAGGDGTINEVARALAGRRTVLGIIPIGTGNGFARDLGLFVDPDTACKRILTAQIKRVDLGVLNGKRVFASICGTGFDAWAAQRANDMRWINRFSGFMRYAVSGILTLFEFKPQHMRVTVGNQSYEGPCLMVTVANGEQFGFGATIAPGASLTDGNLDVVVLPPMNLFYLVRNAICLYTKQPMVGAHRMLGKKIRIEGLQGGKAPLHVDGECVGKGDAVISVKPLSLSVLIPS